MKGMLPNLFFKGSIKLITKQHKDIRKRDQYKNN
jgi:hypothetical protein